MMKCKGKRSYSKEQGERKAEEGFNKRCVKCYQCAHYHVIDELPQVVMGRIWEQLEQERRAR